MLELVSTNFQIFIGFVIKQFELIEDGQLRHSDLLIPHIFNFLVLLSYEKYHSKTIIGMPKIIQLCDGIMASGQQPTTHGMYLCHRAIYTEGTLWYEICVVWGSYDICNQTC